MVDIFQLYASIVQSVASPYYQYASKEKVSRRMYEMFALK